MLKIKLIWTYLKNNAVPLLVATGSILWGLLSWEKRKSANREADLKEGEANSIRRAMDAQNKAEIEAQAMREDYEERKRSNTRRDID